MVIGVGEKKPKFYEGENKYKAMFDFMNVFSETFFKVGEDKTKASEVTKQDKPWLNEVTKNSNFFFKNNFFRRKFFLTNIKN